MSNKTKLKRYTVLHVCNNLSILTARSWILARMGYRVLSSPDGFEAIRTAGRTRVDAVLLDLDHDSPEAGLIIQRIKEKKNDIPILLMTENPLSTSNIHELAEKMLVRLATVDSALETLEGLIKTGLSNKKQGKTVSSHASRAG